MAWTTKHFLRVLILAPILLALPACRSEKKTEPVDGLGDQLPNIPTGPPGTFLEVGNMGTARKLHKACPLPIGDVLVAGGEDGGGNALDLPELYEYTTGDFLGLPYPMIEARVDFSMTLMVGDSKVLLCGGRNSTGVLDSAELFESTTYLFTATSGNLNTAREDHAAILLPNGNVFVSGGRDASGTVLASCEVYDRQNDTFLNVANSLSAARAELTLTLLDNGKILVAGGVDGTGTPMVSAEIFDPGPGLGDQGTFAATGPLPAGRALHLAVKINLGPYGGQVVLFGGYQGTTSSPIPLSSAVAFDPTANALVGAFIPIAKPMASTRMGLTATMLTGGMKVLVVGGNDQNVPEIFDPYASSSGGSIAFDGDFLRTQDGVGTDTTQTAVTQGRSFHTATWLKNGTILLCGGEDGGAVIGTAEIYNP